MKLEKTLTWLFCATLMLCAASVARAEDAQKINYGERGFYLGLSTGAVGGIFTGTPMKDKESEWSWLYGARGGYRFLPWLATETNWERYHNFNLYPSGLGSVSGDFNGWSLTQNVKAIYGTEAAQPYAKVGVGIMHGERRLDNYPTDGGPITAADRQNATDFALRAGIGMDVYVVRSVSIGGEAAFVVPFGSLSDEYFVTLLLDAVYHF